ncbi:MAG: 6,7-dimethyl-8-ribityllumazine synthase [Dehalococcoidia bacterium]
MPEVLKGHLDGRGLRIAIAAARFNAYITERLLDSAVARLAELGVADSDIRVAWVPGSFELPFAAARLAADERVDAVICLGAVIEGETAHFEYVARSAAEGIARVGAEARVPVIFGVLTAYTTDQAFARVGHGAGYAEAAVEMATLGRSLDDAG